MDKTITAALTVLLSPLVYWLIKIWYDRYQENKEISILASMLKYEIRRIREDIEERKRKWHPGEREFSGDLEFEKSVSKEFGKHYEAKRGDLGIFRDIELTNKINKFYEMFGKWKEVREESIVHFKKNKLIMMGYHPAGNPIEERIELEKRLIKIAQELENELDKKMKK